MTDHEELVAILLEKRVHTNESGGKASADADAILDSAWLAKHDAEVAAKVWDEAVAISLNHAIRNTDKITLRLEHLDGRPWQNPYRATFN